MWTRPLRRILHSSRTSPIPQFHVFHPPLVRYTSSAPLIPRVAMPLAHKFANDRIFIDSLRLKCVCGPDAFGRTKAQPVDLSIRLGTLIERAAATDRVDLSVDYSELSKQLTKLEAQGFESPVELIDTIVDLAMEKEGVWHVSVAVNLSKGARTAKNVKWERNTFPAEGVTDEWKLSFEGIEVPIIIGIEENLHERTMKQIVSIDLTWTLRNSDSTEFSIHDFPGAVDSVIEEISESRYQSIETLASVIANFALDSHFAVSPWPHSVSVTVRKPNALPFASAAGVTIERNHRARVRSQNGGDEVYIALGSNLGDRLGNFDKALKMLQKEGLEILDVSGLYESEPMYVEEQPQFLNAVCKARTVFSPEDLLTTLKRIEVDLGREESIRNGPRTLDLDILLHGDWIVLSDNLIIPHVSMLERGFVLQPLADVAPNLIHPTTFSSIRSHLEALPHPSQHNFLPLRSTSLTLDPSHHRKPTLLMGILNLTPDSFSDGGKHSLNGESIVKTVRQMIDDGAHIIDIGGQSTRPNADEVTLEEELDRVIPAIQAIRHAGLKIPISIDTYQSAVAEAAIQEGADIINDVSAGTLDPAMFPLMAKLNVPTILMHMRGTPKTMNSLTEYHGDLIDTIAQELSTRVDEAIRSGIRRWNIILDPGLGFAKQGAQNVEVLRRLGELRAHPKLSGMPWLVGPSRKRFIGKITGEEIAKERIWGTAGAVAASVQGGADIVRVHDIPEMSKIVKMSDAIWRNV